MTFRPYFSEWLVSHYLSWWTPAIVIGVILAILIWGAVIDGITDFMAHNIHEGRAK